MRLAEKKKGEDNSPICKVCEERKERRLKKWLEDMSGETIWTGDLQDENGRIALVTLKFELKEWLSGDLVNGLVGRKENYSDLKIKFQLLIKDLVQVLSDFLVTADFSKLKAFASDEQLLNEFLNLFDKKGIVNPFFNAKKEKNIKKFLTQPKNNLNEKDLSLKDLFFRCVETVLSLINKTFKDFVTYLEQVKNGRSNYNNSEKRFKNQQFLNDKNILDILKNAFSIGFLITQIRKVFLERSIGTKWETLITNIIGKDKIHFEKRKIYWEKLDNNDIDFLSKLFLQFLLRKNPSPARLRRIWETTQAFFTHIKENILEFMEIPSWRCKRLVWSKDAVNGDESKYKEKEFELGNLNFWADKDGTVYLISSLAAALPTLAKDYTKKDFDKIRKQIENEDTSWLKDKEVELREYENTEGVRIKLKLKKSVRYETYLPYFSILDPTPISWQFIIPADTVPAFINNVQKYYQKEFKFVIGKLPLHIGIVVQNYKRPLYVGIKALRNIRRDIKDWKDIKREIDAKSLKAMQKEAFMCHESVEDIKKLEEFYSLYEKKTGKGKYRFYLNPTSYPIWLDITQDVNDNEIFCVYPNTIDFEFLDVNTRRNEIYYKNGQRVLETKKNRPYDWQEWQTFICFKNFFQDKVAINKLHQIVSLIYTKLNDWKDNKEAIKNFFISAFINTFELKEETKHNKFAQLLGQKTWQDVENMPVADFEKRLWQFLDMFDFWHTALKQV